MLVEQENEEDAETLIEILQRMGIKLTTLR
jgi:hypothetical protein